jgi:hypothetical protein
VEFSGFLLIPLAAVITACWIIGAALLSKRPHWLRIPFLISYGLGVIFMQPWLIASWQDAGMMGVMLVMLMLSIAAGCVIGAIPSKLVVTFGHKASRYLNS